MESEETQMTGEESLKIITDMINKTKVNLRQGSFHLLFWGWLILFCNSSAYLLYKFTSFERPWMVWYLVIPGMFVSFIYGFIKGRQEKTHTYAGSIYTWTWLGFSIAAIVLFILLRKDMGSVGPFIITLAGLPTFLSGFILKFKPLVIGGITFWICALISTFSGPAASPIIFSISILTGYLIPGYLLKEELIMTQFRDLDPILHSQLRLAIASLLMEVESAEFNYLLERTGATNGNLSIQISKLKEAGYIEVKKTFRKNYPLTSCSITEKGKEAFNAYIIALSGYLKIKSK